MTDSTRFLQGSTDGRKMQRRIKRIAISWLKKEDYERRKRGYTKEAYIHAHISAKRENILKRDGVRVV